MTHTLLHVSDPHLDGGPAAAARLAAVLDLLPATRRPDAIVVTGDVADTGSPAEYAQFHRLMSGREPWIAAPGNHDDPSAFGGGEPVSALDLDGLRVLALDVTVPGHDHGELRPEVADRAAELAAGAPATVLSLHQPPVRLGHSYVDNMLLRNPKALAELVERVGTVAAILCGHLHTPATATFAGVPLLLAPGVHSALRPDPDHRPLTNREHPPGLALHRIDADGVTTQFHYAA